MTTNKKDNNTDFEVRSLDAICKNQEAVELPMWHNLKYLAFGVAFGIVLIKSEVISWFRIQEMFRLQSFHMYGVIGTAVVVGAISVFLIKKFKIKTVHGEEITFTDKKFNKGQIIGGLIFGLGWALVGACPGPMFVLAGNGYFFILVVIAGAVFGTYTYGMVKDKLPH